MPGEVDGFDEGDGGRPELPPEPGADVPNMERTTGASDADDGTSFESGHAADIGFGQLQDPDTDQKGHEPRADEPGWIRDVFGEEELPSPDQVVGRADDILGAERDSAVDHGDTPETPVADARETEEHAAAEAVKFLRSVDSTVFGKALVVTDADVEVVVKALRDAVQKLGPERVLAIVAQLAGDRETLKALLLIADTSTAPTWARKLVERFRSKGLLFTGAALVCAAGIPIALLGGPSGEAALTNETAIGALVVAVAALFKR